MKELNETTHEEAKIMHDLGLIDQKSEVLFDLIHELSNAVPAIAGTVEYYIPQEEDGRLIQAVCDDVQVGDLKLNIVLTVYESFVHSSITCENVKTGFEDYSTDRVETHDSMTDTYVRKEKIVRQMVERMVAAIGQFGATTSGEIDFLNEGREVNEGSPDRPDSGFERAYQSPKHANESIQTPEQAAELKTMVEIGLMEDTLADAFKHMCTTNPSDWRNCMHSVTSGDSVIVSDRVIKPVELHPKYGGYVKIGDFSYIVVRDEVPYICMNYVCESRLLDDDMPTNAFGPGNAVFYSRYRDWVDGIKWRWAHACRNMADLDRMIEQFNSNRDAHFEQFGSAMNESIEHGDLPIQYEEVETMMQIGLLTDNDQIVFDVANRVAHHSLAPGETSAEFARSNEYGLIATIPCEESGYRFKVRVIHFSTSIVVAVLDPKDEDQDACDMSIMTDRGSRSVSGILTELDGRISMLYADYLAQQTTNESIDSNSVMQQLDVMLDLGIVESDLFAEMQQLPNVCSGINRVNHHDGYGIINVMCDHETLPVPKTHPKDERFRLIGNYSKLVRKDDPVESAYVYAQYVTVESTDGNLPNDAYSEEGIEWVRSHRNNGNVMGYSWNWRGQINGMEDVLTMINEFSDERTRSARFVGKGPGGRFDRSASVGESHDGLADLDTLIDLGILENDYAVLKNVINSVERAKKYRSSCRIDCRFEMNGDVPTIVGTIDSPNWKTIHFVFKNDTWRKSVIVSIGDELDVDNGDRGARFHYNEWPMPESDADWFEKEIMHAMIKWMNDIEMHKQVNESNEYDVMSELGLFDPVQTVAIKTGNMMIENFPNELTNLRFDLESSIKICRATADFINHHGWSITASVINYDDDETARVVLRVADMFGAERASSRSLLAPDDTDLSRRNENKHILSALKEIMEKVRLLHVKPIHENVDPGTLEQLRTMVELGMVEDDFMSQFMALPDVDPTFLRYDAPGDHPYLIVTDETLAPPPAVRGLGDGFRLMGKTFKLSLFPSGPAEHRVHHMQIDAFYSTEAFDAKYGSDMPHVLFGNSAWSWKAKLLGPRSKLNKGIVQVTWDTIDPVESVAELLELLDAFNADPTNLRCSINDEVKESRGYDRSSYVSPLGIRFDELVVMRDIGLYHMLHDFEYCRDQGDWDFSGQQQEIDACSTSTIDDTALVDLVQMTVCSDFVQCTVRFSDYRQVVAGLERGKDTFRFTLTTYGGHRAGHLYIAKADVVSMGMELGSIALAVATIASRRWPKSSRSVDESLELDRARMEEVRTLSELGIERDTVHARALAMHELDPKRWIDVVSSGDGDSFVGITVPDWETYLEPNLSSAMELRKSNHRSKLGNTSKLLISRRYDSPNPAITQQTPIYDLDVILLYVTAQEADLLMDQNAFSQENRDRSESANSSVVRFRYKKHIPGLEGLDAAVRLFSNVEERYRNYSRTID